MDDHFSNPIYTPHVKLALAFTIQKLRQVELRYEMLEDDQKLLILDILASDQIYLQWTIASQEVIDAIKSLPRKERHALRKRLYNASN